MEDKKKKHYTNACPKCGSTNYHIESDLSWMTGNQGIYVCNDCGHNAPFFPEVEADKLKTFKSEAKEVEKKKPAP